MLKNTVYVLMAKGYSPAMICKFLGLSKTRVQYHLSTLKREGFIKKVKYGEWKVYKKKYNFNKEKNKEVKNLTRSQVSEVRGHGFMVNVKVPLNILNYIHYRKDIVKYSSHRYKYSDDNVIIHFFRRSFNIYFKNSIFGSNASEIYLSLLKEINGVCKNIEKIIKKPIKVNAQYVFKVVREHYSLVNNGIARYHRGKRKKLEISDDYGVWLKTDFSERVDELEVLKNKDPKTFQALDDTNNIRKWYNDHKKHNFEVTPTFLMETLSMMAQSINQMLKVQADYSVSIQNHVGAIKKLGDNVEEFTRLIEKLLKIKNF